jgi:3-hydroxyacyl-CoA dehydrogenase/enoyl-CoA hydratase/3-hydroxybutyryl-CoA epimerase
VLYESSNVRVEADDQIATLWLDCRGRPDNRLTLDDLNDLERALLAVRRAPCLDVLVVRSAKPRGFSPGYDLDEFAGLRAAEERIAFAARGQQITQLLETAGENVLTVAVIEGECRSAGLEIALACDYRLAVARPDTVFGFPEVRRGLAPFWGGTLRLPRLVGLGRALRLLLDGRELSAREALRWGLIDFVCGERQERIETRALLDRLQDYPRTLPAPRSLVRRVLDGVGLARWSAFRRAEGRLAEVNEYDRPAARTVLNAVQKGYAAGAEALAAERNACGELGATAACRNALEHERRAAQPPRVYPEPVNPVTPAPERVAVVGGGELGAALARWFALLGRVVTVQEANDDALGRFTTRLEAEFRGVVARGILTRAEAEQAKKNVRKTTAWNGFEEAGLVVEAADEDLGVKRGIFHELERRVRPRTVLATASSTLRVEALQAELQRPGRVAGLHFLEADSPVVEVVRAPATDSGTLSALAAWLRTWGKTPLLVADRPGRLVNRVRLAYLSEAVVLVAEGLPPELIDREMRRFGMECGPLETIDAIGFDRLAGLVENMQHARGDGFARNLLLERMRAFGWDGREGGEGFYRYRRGRGRENQLARMVLWRDTDDDVISHYVFDPQESLEDGVERLILRSVNEAAACLGEEYDADPGTIDLALAWGMGWAPHRGGPLRHADGLGLATVAERLAEFAERFGKRFEPSVELQRRAEAGESFYQSEAPAEVLPRPAVRRLAG